MRHEKSRYKQIDIARSKNMFFVGIGILRTICHVKGS
jgi:hypothetical protein